MTIIKILNNKKFIIIGLLVVALLFVLFLVSNNSKLPDNSKFSLLDKESDILLSEDVFLLEEVRKNFEENALKWKTDAEKNAWDGDDLVVAYNNRALFHSYLGEYKTAYDLYLESINIKPEFRLTWVSLGDLLVLMRAYKSAEASYVEAISLNKFDHLQYLKLANLYKITEFGTDSQVFDTYKLALENMENSTANKEPIYRDYIRFLDQTGLSEEATIVRAEFEQYQESGGIGIDPEFDDLN